MSTGTSGYTAGGQVISVDEIKQRLEERLLDVLHTFAPMVEGGHHDGQRWCTVNPGRADRRPGSFFVATSGVDRGRWVDFAMAPRGNARGPYATGDLIDLIGMVIGADNKGAIREARAFLGLAHEAPEDARRRAERRAALDEERRALMAKRQADQVQKQRWAAGLWLSGQEAIEGTPVDLYLRGRGIDLAQLGHWPGALRYHAEARYYWQEEDIDPETGEVRVDPRSGRVRMITRHRPMPAMLTVISRHGKIADCHRTYLAPRDAGWTKADVPDAKKVFGDYTGGIIPLCAEAGPRGGRQRLADAAPGARVFVTEGVENGLSLMMLRHLTGRPPAFVVAAGSLWNMSNIILPRAFTDITLAADNDQGEQAQDMLARAVAFHQKLGRTVRIWRSPNPGEDMNDALRRVLDGQDGVAP